MKGNFLKTLGEQTEITGASNGSLSGLSNTEAEKRLLKFGKNIVEEKCRSPLLFFVKKFWAPVPWMLETTIILQIILKKPDEAVIIAALLLFNAVLSFLQERKTNKALRLLRNRLSIYVRVRRDSKWQSMPAQGLVPGDVIYLRMGDIVPADIRILDGKLLVDQSTLTGEALPIDTEANRFIYASSLIKRGEATAEVVATGKNTFFGKTVELLQTAKVPSHIEQVIFSIVKYLTIVNTALVALITVCFLFLHIPLFEAVPFILILLIASVPIALQATFTLATTYGALQLANQGILTTHLSALENAAAMEILCTDKTGTLTKNQLKVEQLKAYNAFSNEQLLHFAALVCDEATQDPIDEAILSAASTIKLTRGSLERIEFIPFDPANKYSEAVFKSDEETLRIIKGAPNVVVDLLENKIDISEEANHFSQAGNRIIAVAISKEKNQKIGKCFELVGLITLQDPLREDAKSVIKALQDLGIRVIMITGDGVTTAKTIAERVGIGSRVCETGILTKDKNEILNFDVFAGVFPQEKFNLVCALQQEKYVVGMTGDGVNDAPALKQAEVGIAVTNASDIAKTSASVVLNETGLNGIIAAIDVGRQIYQRMLTYILNKIIKSFTVSIFLSIGVMITGHLIITPTLVVLLLFTNDFATMSISTDRVSTTKKPKKWEIPNLIYSGGLISIFTLILMFLVFYFSLHFLKLTLPELQTLVFLLLVFTGQGNIYLIRERRRFWNSKPGGWFIAASLLDILIVSFAASRGILMAALNPVLILGLIGLVVIYLFLVDSLKVQIFSRFEIY